MPYLTSDKIKLIKFTEDFITPKYIKWLNDTDINKYLMIPRTLISKKDIEPPDGKSNILLAIMVNFGFDEKGNLFKEEDTDFYSYYIGTISLHSIDYICRKGEIGYMIGEKSYWGRGVATEAIKLITDYAFNYLNINKISANVVEDNLASIKVLEKNGFKLSCVNPEDYYLKNKYYNTNNYYKLRDW